MENKAYKVKITSIDHDTGTETVEAERELKSVFLLGDNAEDEKSFATIILNTSIMKIAAMLASGSDTAHAVKLANVMLGMTEKKASGLEDLLLSAMMKG